MADEYSIGIDLGGTKIEGALIDSSGKILEKKRVATDVKGGPSSVEKQMIEIVQGLEASASIQTNAVGVGVAGQIALNDGSVHFAPNLNWRDVPLQKNLTQALGKQVIVDNDVRCATWGEWLHGAGIGYQDLVCIFVGTGIGGGVVSGGKLLKGASNTLGEIGHMTIELMGPVCTCGNRGCFESLAGGWGIAKKAQESVRTYQDQGKVMLELAEGQIDKITAKIVVEAVRKNDPLAKLILERAKQALAVGCTNVVNAFNPALLILGGGIIDSTPEMFLTLEMDIRQHALIAATEGLEVVTSKLGKDAGVIGAAALAKHEGKKK